MDILPRIGEADGMLIASDRNPNTTGAKLLGVATGKLADIAAASWDACAGGDNPFVSHAFLLALEESKSTGRGTGWLPLELARLLGECTLAKRAAHGIGEPGFERPSRAMYQIGG